jgi:mannosyltransferase OCH1-like enzyme
VISYFSSPSSASWWIPMISMWMNWFVKDLVTTARKWQVWWLHRKVTSKFMSYVLQTPRLRNSENSRIV